MKSEKEQSADYQLLTPLYARWMDDLLGGQIPRESKATCDDCAMCAKPGEAIDGDQFFDPAVKCCSIVPELSNFLVGGILSGNGQDTESLHGRESVLGRIREATAVTPLGLAQTPVFRLIYDNSDQAFGRSRTLRCPHYVEGTGRCGIWRNRGATCVAWFCKFVRGAVGRAFWRGSLEGLLGLIERNLAAWCILEVDIGIDAVHELFGTGDDGRPAPLTAAQLDNRPDQARQRRIWGKWFGREQDFFIECARLVEPLSWARVLEICGSQTRVQADLTRQAYKNLSSEEIPPALKVGSLQLVQMTSSVSRVRTYSDLDPVDIPAPVMETLGYFDGRSTQAALKAIATEKGIHLNQDLIRKLCDFQLLVPADRAQSNE